ncbi:MAG: hypothetical protein ACI89X_005095 [Planctomycetota bacterium]|jgi:hypothetical protein
MILQALLSDSSTPVKLLVVGIGAVFVIIYGLKWRAEKSRTKAISDIAEDLGLRFDSEHDHDHWSKFHQFESFDRGRTRYAKNTLRGTMQLFGKECELLAGDYRAFSRHTNLKFSYLIVHLPRRTPSLLIRRETVLDKIKSVVGFGDIQFESGEFDSKFLIRSDDEPFAREILDRGMIQFLMRELPPMIHIAKGAVLLTGVRRRWAPDQFAAQIAFVTKFCEQWPQEQEDRQSLPRLGGL